MKTSPQRRNPWPIVIIAFFIFFASGLITFIVFASSQHVDLVRNDYYEEEIRYQEQLDRVERTRKLEAPIQVSYDSRRQCITIQLPAAPAVQAGGAIHLYRPSDERLDQHIPLHLDPNGTQVLDATGLHSGLWKVRLQWTVDGQEFFVDRPIVVPGPGHAS